MIIGITGKSGCGKSSLAKYLVETRENTVHLNIDTVGHKANESENVKAQLKEQFGQFIFIDGKVDRKRLGSIVFNSEEAMQMLKEITWTEMKKMIDEFIAENEGKDIILDWFMIPETDYFKECDVTVFIDVPFEIRLERAQKRDGICADKFKERESKSIDYSKYEFDFVIDNIDFERAKEKVRKIA